MKNVVAIVPSGAAVDRWYRALDGKAIGGSQPWIAEVVGVHVEGPWRWVQIRPRHAPHRELVLTFAEPLSLARALEALQGFRFDPVAPFPQLVTVPLIPATAHMSGAPVSLDAINTDRDKAGCVAAGQPSRAAAPRRTKNLRRDDCVGRDAWVSSAVWPDQAPGSEPSGLERRHDRRTQVSLACQVAGDGRVGESRVVDLSLNGCRVETRTHSSYGEIVTIVLAKNAGGLTHLMGTVVHALPRSGFSMQFGSLGRATRRQVSSFLTP